MLHFLRRKLPPIRFERRLHMRSNLPEIYAIGFRPLRFRLQQIIAHVRPRYIHIRPYLIQHAILKQELLPDPIVVRPKISKHPQRIDSGNRDDSDQAPKPEGERDPAAVFPHLMTAYPNFVRKGSFYSTNGSKNTNFPVS